jgi:hypothetical protein
MVDNARTDVFHYSDAIRIAKEGYAEALRTMSEEDLLDDEERDSAVFYAIETAFMKRVHAKNI